MAVFTLDLDPGSYAHAGAALTSLLAGRACSVNGGGYLLTGDLATFVLVNFDFAAPGYTVKRPRMAFVNRDLVGVEE